MKIYSLYYKERKFIAAFPTREEAVKYGKSLEGDPWDYNITEEYINKSPFTYNPITIPGPIKIPDGGPYTIPHSTWNTGVIGE